MTDRGLARILAAFPGKRILVVGDVMLDEFVWGDAQRISPEAPVLVVETRRRTYVPGGAANAAVNVASLGGHVQLCGIVGADPQADQLRQALRERGVESGGLFTDPERPTTSKTRIIAHHQQVVRLDNEQRAPLPAALEDRLLGWLNENLAQSDACILSDYAKGIVSPRFARQLIESARRAGKAVLVDPKGDDCSKYAGATVVKPNLAETQRFLKRELAAFEDILRAGAELPTLLAGSSVLMTLGAHGMALFRKDSAPVHIRSVARDVFDVTGAGDTVIGTLALALAAGATLEQAARLGNYAAGIVVGKVGTSTVTLAELQTKQRRRRGEPADKPRVPRMRP
jgi:rfaE bifunctional protein kinase chain/domain